MAFQEAPKGLQLYKPGSYCPNCSHDHCKCRISSAPENCHSMHFQKVSTSHNSNGSMNSWRYTFWHRLGILKRSATANAWEDLFIKTSHLQFRTYLIIRWLPYAWKGMNDERISWVSIVSQETEEGFWGDRQRLRRSAIHIQTRVSKLRRSCMQCKGYLKGWLLCIDTHGHCVGLLSLVDVSFSMSVLDAIQKVILACLFAKGIWRHILIDYIKR